MPKNPFSKSGQPADGKPPSRPTPSPPEVRVSEDVSDLCPFIGTFPLMSAPSKIQGPGPIVPDIQHVLMPCVRDRCAMWDAERGGCSVRLGLQAMSEMKDPLVALGQKFGR